MADTIKNRIDRGVKLLDEHYGRKVWLSRIRPTRLDLSRGRVGASGCGCVLAQLDGSFDGGRFRLHLTIDDARRAGFEISLDGVEGYETLTERWRERIAELRKEQVR